MPPRARATKVTEPAAPTEITIRYDRDVVGHPPRGSVVTVERTDQVQALLDLGVAVEVDAEPTTVVADELTELAAPVITAPVDGETLTTELVSVAGTVAQDGAVEVYVGDTAVAQTTSSGGQFVAQVDVQPGEIALSACVTVDGQTSPWATSVTVTVAASEPEPAG